MIQTVTKERARHVLLVGDSTLDPLARLLERGTHSIPFKATAAPYGQIYQILLDATHAAWAMSPDILVVWTEAQLTLPSFSKLVRFNFLSATSEYEATLQEAEQFADAVVNAAQRVGLVLVPTWSLPSHERWIQTLAWKQGVGPANLLSRANLILAEKFSAQRNIILIDSSYWKASVGRQAYDMRMFAFGKILFSHQLFEKAAVEIRAVLDGLAGLGKKVIVCDLDNTLWGGVVGDDGLQNIKLGAPDPVGECYQAFQAVLKGLSSRGILLAISSKNEEKLALSVIEEHPAMLLRKEDFAAWRINWKDKAENLLELADELNLGLDSFVFLDDSPQERDQIRQLVPQVYAPDLPASPADLASFLSSLSCFETSSLGKEDLERSRMYRAERSRREALTSTGSVESWLRSLEIQVCVTPLKPETLPRAAQLLNKTNQFNLSLRRLDEESFWEWTQRPSNSAYTFNVSDRFGDYGLSGLATLSLTGTNAYIVDFVMSCRVMGKGVEEALLGYVQSRALSGGAVRITAVPVEGPRNQPARSFFAAKAPSEDPNSIDQARVAIPAQISLKEEKLKFS